MAPVSGVCVMGIRLTVHLVIVETVMSILPSILEVFCCFSQECIILLSGNAGVCPSVSSKRLQGGSVSSAVVA